MKRSVTSRVFWAGIRIATLVTIFLLLGATCSLIVFAPHLYADTPPVIGHIVPPSDPGPPPGPTMGLSTTILSFENVVGSTSSSSQSLQIVIYSADGFGTAWQSSAQTDNGANWLSVSPPYGIDDANLTITASAGLPKGTYSGRIVIKSIACINTPLTVSVTYIVRDPMPSSLQVTPAAPAFTALAATQSPAPQQIAISAKGETSLGAWRALASGFNGGNWLSVTPTSGSGPATLKISADLSTLGAGSYAGKIAISADGMSNSPLQVPVSFTVTPQTVTFGAQAVVNAGGFTPGPLAPGEIASVFGTSLGPREGVVATLDTAALKLPTRLGGTSITFDGVPAPLFFSSSGQVTFQVPFELAGKTSSQMTVRVDGEIPATATVSLQDAAPGVFAMGSDNTRAVVLNQDSSLNSPDNPAAPGSIIQIFFTGQGLPDTALPTGAAAPALPPFPGMKLPVSVILDGRPAATVFSGLAPGLVGLAQVNAQIPATVAPSDQVKMMLGVGAFQSQVTTISIH